jgi:predicted DNA-binding transcriptional regulator AlpA
VKKPKTTKHDPAPQLAAGERAAAEKMRAPVTHHLDSRADVILDAVAGTDGDDLLTTVQVAGWLGVSTVFLIMGRSKGYGPQFVRVSPTVVRYRRRDVIAWLESRTYASNAEDPHIRSLRGRSKSAVVA